jgi:putative transposase
LKQNKAYKFRIYPNKEQRQLIEQTFGCTRFLWNQVLAYKIDYYKSTGKTYSKFESINDIKEIKMIEDFKWLKDVDSIALQQSLGDLDIAYSS